MKQARSMAWLAVLGAFAACALRSDRAGQAFAGDGASPDAAATVGVEFEAPVRLKAGDDYISAEAPGYACPTIADVDKDGLDDLVVGQFRNGNMQFCKNIAKSGEAPQFAAPQWIMTGSDRAAVPGVW